MSLFDYLNILILKTAFERKSIYWLFINSKMPVLTFICYKNRSLYIRKKTQLYYAKLSRLIIFNILQYFLICDIMLQDNRSKRAIKNFFI